jgi:uncharacterized caspase-like protein
MIEKPVHPHSPGAKFCSGQLICLLSFLLPLACANNGPLAVNNKVALIIGNSAYTSVSTLTNPAKDATDICSALKRVGFQADCPTQVGTRAEFEAHVKKYVDSLGPNSAGVFYYSGHGVQAAGENYLVPTNARVNSAREDPLPQLYRLSELFDKLRQKPTAFQMVVLDACRTDPFAPPSPGSAGTKSVLDAASRAAFVESLEVVARASYGTALINDAPVGTIVFYATASKDTAYDGVGGNGPLTKHFLRNVEIRGLTVEDLMKNVISGVQDETKQIFGKPQTPFTYQSFRNKFCFAVCFDPSNFQVPPTN